MGAEEIEQHLLEIWKSLNNSTLTTEVERAKIECLMALDNIRWHKTELMRASLR